MGILEGIDQLISGKKANEENAVRLYFGLVARAAFDKPKKSDTVAFIRETLANVGRTPEEFKDAVEGARTRKRLEDLAGENEERQAAFKASTVAIRKLELERDTALAAIKTKAEKQIIKARKHRDECHRAIVESSEAEITLRNARAVRA